MLAYTRGQIFRILICALAAGSLTDPAFAHVKWFNDEYCVTCKPPQVISVFNGFWFILLVCFSLMTLSAFIFDRAYLDRANEWTERKLRLLKASPEDYLRVGLGIFLVCLWWNSGILLTPELHTTNKLLPWLQLGLALTTASWTTTWIACVGLLFLYCFALTEYGVFHLLDYPIFLGIAAYLAIHSLRLNRLLPFAGSVLVTAVSGTLLWASFEKWVYWVWTVPLLAEHSTMTLGMNPKTFIVLAGFVEFFLAYFLLAGRFLGRVSALILLLMFASAVFDFGLIDLVGHLLIIISLIVIILQGVQPVTNLVSCSRLGVTNGAFACVGILVTVLGAYGISYFGLHHLLYE
jgi:hypothetical protein